jgi:hypothetical protein
MPIKIPSKNIYEMNNPKVRDNRIGQVKGEQAIVSPIKGYGVSVYDGKFEQPSKKMDLQEESHIAYRLDEGHYYHYYYSRVEAREERYNIETIKIPIHQKNFYVHSLVLGKNEESDTPNIEVSVSGVYTTGDAEGVFELTSLQGNGYYGGTQYNEAKEETLQNFSFSEDMMTISNDAYKDIGYQFDIKLTIPFYETSLLEATAKLVSEEGKDYFEIKNLSFSCGISKASLNGEHDNPDNAINEDDLIYCYGKYEYYKAQTATITIYGNTIGIDLTDGSVTYGSGNKPHSLSGNELMQDSAKVGNTPLTEYLANNVLTQYKNGKETATLLCSISDYYDYDTNEKMIDITSSDKMSFKLHDQVIPMVYGADGKDRPMSLYRDGTPKVFQVLGSKIFYDGAVWQELSLQEVTKG